MKTKISTLYVSYERGRHNIFKILFLNGRDTRLFEDRESILTWMIAFKHESTVEFILKKDNIQKYMYDSYFSHFFSNMSGVKGDNIDIWQSVWLVSWPHYIYFYLHLHVENNNLNNLWILLNASLFFFWNMKKKLTTYFLHKWLHISIE